MHDTAQVPSIACYQFHWKKGGIILSYTHCCYRYFEFGRVLEKFYFLNTLEKSHVVST
jgi:hypothetical protein